MFLPCFNLEVNFQRNFILFTNSCHISQQFDTWLVVNLPKLESSSKKIQNLNDQSIFYVLGLPAFNLFPSNWMYVKFFSARKYAIEFELKNHIQQNPRWVDTAYVQRIARSLASQVS